MIVRARFGLRLVHSPSCGMITDGGNSRILASIVSNPSS